MTIFVKGHNFKVELERLCRLFFPDEKIRTVEADTDRDSIYAASILDSGTVISYFYDGNMLYESRDEVVNTDDEEKLNAALAYGLYKHLCASTGYTPPWGMLTGVRPVKLYRMLCEQKGEAAAKSAFMDDFRCSAEKTKLCAETMRYEQPLLDMSRHDSFSLYISIPFCPTRCSYCSFVSQSVEKSAKLIDPYVDALIKEIEETAGVAKSLGLRLETVYMGGGTPTTLSADQMARVLGSVNSSFDISNLREFTVEAGRPDTVTPEKLQAIKNAGVERISINPQTLNQNVLDNIGRRHTVEQVYDAMEMAKKTGFECVNMDLIAGLSGDTPESFSKTLDGVLSLEPGNITVHTLSMKRASTMVTGEGAKGDRIGGGASDMLSECSKRFPVAGYHPYYLYRQTRMVGNLENVGWAKDGLDGLYNVYIMDETHTILAVGAGGVTKLRQPNVNNIERIYNYKFPYEYLSGFDEIINRKKGVREFYEKFC